MRRPRVLHALAVLGLLALLFGGQWLWRNRPWRMAIAVNGRTLSAGELDMRTRTLLDDARRVDHVKPSPDGEEALLRTYRRQAAQKWIVKEVLLSEALVRGYELAPEDTKAALAQVAARLRGRNLTPDEFFREGPLPEAVKRRDFSEGVLINKFVAKEVRDVIVVPPEDVDARMAKICQEALLAAKPGEKARKPPSRRRVGDMLRAERFRRGCRQLIRGLFAKAEVKCPEFPELETLDGISPSRPEDKEKMQELK